MKFIAGTALLVVACAPAAQRVALQPGATVTPEQRLALWQGPRADTLHGVQVGDSAVSGVPLAQPTFCDSCRVTFSLANVDSVLALPPGHSRLTPAAVAAAAAALSMAGIWAWSD